MNTALSQFILRGLLPMYNTDESGGGAGGGETKPTGGDTPGGKPSKGAVQFKDQETFEAVLNSRISQAKRSWEAEERPKIVEEVSNEVKKTIEDEAKRAAAEESGEYKKLYETILAAEGVDSIPKDSHLYKVVETLVKDREDTLKAVEKLVEEESADLSDKMKALIPEGYSAQKKLDWIRNAKSADPNAGNVKRGAGHVDPKPSGNQGRTVEDVMAELQGRIGYGTNRSA